MPVINGLPQDFVPFPFNFSVNDDQGVTEHTLINFSDYARLGVPVNILKDRAPNRLNKWTIRNMMKFSRDK